jgi:hypothetical protein
MSLAARITPQVIAHGLVTRLEPKEYDGKYTGTAVQLETDGGPLLVKFRADADASRPAIGATVALLTEAYDGERGSTLTFVRYITADDLGRLEATFRPAKAA